MLRYITNQIEKASQTANTEFSRILSAAVINKQFRSALLSDPSGAVASGYCGEPFYLSADQKQRISAIHSRSLEEFAAQLAQI
ncbi:MAG TPA: hypothetical protein VMW28_06080 [Pelolinea sp.]|nr:hypothetical protein [Pelolinea sp.]